MKVSIKKKWIAALRSGKYKQIRCALKHRVGPKTFGYCCLGVLTDLYCKSKRLPNAERKRLFLGGRGLVAPEVQRWIGMTTFRLRQAVNMNDQRELDFKTIADVVEDWK